MGKQKTTRVSFLARFLIGTVFLAVMVNIAIGFPPESRSSMKAKVIITRVWMQGVVSFLSRHVNMQGDLTGMDSKSISRGVIGTNNFQPSRLNVHGELLDYWKSPIQIQISAGTNFVVRSPGPNRKSGDDDDIVFDSQANGFIEP